MSDIFISYASQDRERAKELADAFSHEGWLVWWDRKIPYGDSFDRVIEEQIALAKVVVVLWSSHAVNSEWVRNEARESKSRKTLVPIIVEPIAIPLEFRHLQAVDLTDWKANSPHAQFAQLTSQLRDRLADPQRQDPLLTSAPAHVTIGTPDRNAVGSAPKKSRMPRSLAYLIGFVLLVGAVGMGVFQLSPTSDETAAKKFEGSWVEAEVAQVPGRKTDSPLHLNVSRQSKGALTVRISGTDDPGQVFGVAYVRGGVATWSAPQTCRGVSGPVGRYEWTLMMDGSILVYISKSTSNVPCMGHPAGVERSEKRLKRVSGGTS